MKAEELIMARLLFAKEYCEEKGWDTSTIKLNIDQITEIRKQEGWKNPTATRNIV